MAITPKHNRLTTALGAGLIAALGLTACGNGGETEAVGDTDENIPGELQEGGSLTIGISGDPGNLDPTFASTLTSLSVYNAMCELLYNADDEGNVYPQLAADSPEFSEDGQIATIPLREDVVFQDGTLMDAEAVKFSIDRHMEAEGSQRSGELSAVESVEVVDEHTVDIHLVEPTAPGAFDVIFTDRAGIIVSPTAVGEAGDEAFAESPVCVGPFAFESRMSQDHIRLTKDENYYNADNVYLDEVTYQVITDSNVRVTNLRSGDVDVIERVPTTDVEDLESASGVVLERREGLGYMNIDINIGNVDGNQEPAGQVEGPLAENPDVRRALEMSLDREAINQVVFNGEYEVACGFMAPSSELATEATLACPGYDPDGAADLLEQAGVDTPLEVELMINTMPEMRRMGEMIQSMAGEVGFEVTLDIQESTVTIERGYGGDYETYINSWSGRIDPDANISQFVASDSPRTMTKYSNEEVDELLAAARAAQDPEERAEMYEQINAQLREDLPMIFLVRPVNLVGIRDDVAGIELRPNGSVVPTYAGFVED
ncbi:ABC transporter substrate-binding protein [Nesterenkonia ebinurensis]|uniref:ABC transporter substrate-binding protein n=1 Tax=Nesterenkonia ebinurensis TaxID=2608252 RepID=UPI00123D1DEB|nr:ABC transporter substrate-binding protein [Nesterenkonia ebinurensis]